jgi:MFS family permease
VPALSFLDKHYAVAPPGFSRWLVPPAALAIHLSIGEVYAFSVFKIPLTQAIGITERNPAVDWSQPEIAWIFSIAIAFLGISTAVFGGWLERVGPRKVMFAAACCFGGGFLVGAAGVHWHQIWLLYLGYGVIGGIGLGLGYISPVATLVRWFPDRPGLATGLAIMGFGGGALIGSPLERFLMSYFRSPTSVGVTGAMVVMGIAYFCFMMFGVFTIRTPPPGWRPAGWAPKPQAAGGMITTHVVDWHTALRTPQFYLLWLVLCLNTTAGIGIIEQASPMIQDMFAGTWATPAIAAAAATGFVGLLSLFNMGGRFFWSAISDYIGRKWTYMCFFVIGVTLYALVPQSGVQRWNSIALFVLFCGVLISMYGGGFSTMPAFVRDLFGARDLSQIYGRILTAWSVAGIAGPSLVNYIREYQLNHGVARTNAYSTVLYVMSGLLFLGLICNALIRPVSERAYATEDGGPAGPRGFDPVVRPETAPTQQQSNP